MRTHPITGGRNRGGSFLMEHRSDWRYLEDGRVLFTVFNSDDPPRTGHLRNYCDQGVYFETANFVRPGTTLHLRIDPVSTRDSDPNSGYGCRSVSLAEVKWCRAIDDANAPRFGIGAKYY